MRTNVESLIEHNGTLKTIIILELIYEFRERDQKHTLNQVDYVTLSNSNQLYASMWHGLEACAAQENHKR